MGEFYSLLIEWGYYGMGIAAFIAGSIFPFSSEIVLIALQQLKGIDSLLLFMCATTGNVLGSVVTYYLGRASKQEWLEIHLHIKHRRIVRAQLMVRKFGSWIGFFCFIPFIGNAMVVTLGLMRVKPSQSLVCIALGKASRYAVVMMFVHYIIMHPEWIQNMVQE